MNLENRIKKLEANINVMNFDPIVDAELTEWLKSHPEYKPLTQPENNNGIEMPEHLSQAFSCRMNKLFAERNLDPDLSNLHIIYEDLF